MYTLLRNVHLALGLFTSMFLFAYGLSAFEMGHPFLFGWSTASVTQQSVAIGAEHSAPRSLAPPLDGFTRYGRRPGQRTELVDLH